MHEGSRILIATPVKNSEHELPVFFSSILRLTHPKHLVSLFLLESDSEDRTDNFIREFIISQKTQTSDFRLQKISYRRLPVGFRMSPESRHAEDVQLRRRQVLAQARNAILDSADLEHVDYVLWLDVDATGFPDSLIEDLIAIKKPIVAPHVVWDFGGITYDRNSWLETYSEIFRAESGKPMFEGYGDSEGARIYMDDFRLIARGRFAEVPLHGVGTAVLLVEAKIHREAKLKFPVEPYKRRVESEGFGLVAMDAGFQAVGLPNYEVKHVNHADFPGRSFIFSFDFILVFTVCALGLVLLFDLYRRAPKRVKKFF